MAKEFEENNFFYSKSAPKYRVRVVGSGDRYLNHLYTNKKWHVKQERIQIVESIHIPSCKGQQVQKMRKDSSREWCVRQKRIRDPSPGPRNGDVETPEYDYRYYGYSVRPVRLVAVD